MNPIVYNDKGQFRFNDFVGYLPEFLKTEPDVVTLMQVMSDYINNAYRNIETTEEFEFMRVCSATNVNAVTRAMEKLQEMFELAEDRNESVILMSAPRNNIKSNAVLGNKGAEYAVRIEVDDVDKIKDSIPNAISRGVDPNCIDGSIVYVVYRAMTPVKTAAYYYDSSTDSLILDPMNTSQDPFTGTRNTPNRMIQFDVSDVSKVSKRFGKVVDNMTYYEIFFTMHVLNVKDVNALATVAYDVDSSGNAPDDILVDYYNTSSAGASTYHTYVKFFGTDEFNWKGGYPTGIFYFRDSSTANLYSLTSDGSRVLSADITQSHEVERYRISKIELGGAGMLNVYTEGYPGMYNDSTYYISNVETSEILGVFKMYGASEVNSRLDRGKRYISLVAIDGTDVDTLSAAGGAGLVLSTIPLFYNKGVLDYSHKKKMIRWDKQYLMPSGTQIENDLKVSLYGASVEENELLYANYVPVRTSLMSFKIDADIGNQTLYCNNTLWDGCAKSKSNPLSSTLYKITLDKDTQGWSDPITIYKVTAGFIRIDESDKLVGNGDWSVEYQSGDYVLATRVNDDTEEPRLLQIDSVDNVNKQIVFVSSDLSAGADYALGKVTVDNSVKAKEFYYINHADSVTSAAVKFAIGDIFVQKYMMHFIQNAPPVLLHMVCDVNPVEYRTYSKGEYVSDGKNIYVATKQVTLSNGDNPANMYGFTLDNYAHYSVGYKTVENAFMPFYGQYTTLDYGDRPNYNGDMALTILPLYIGKQNDTRLRYGWEQRQYVNYGENIGTVNRSRSGFAEFYSDMSDRNIVEHDLLTYCDALLDYVIMPSGTESRYVIDIDNNLSATNNYDGTWTVNISSSAHGLPAGARISVDGVRAGNDDLMAIFNQHDVVIDVPTPDSISYTVVSDYNDIGFSYGDKSEASAYYIRDYQYRVRGIKLSIGDDVMRIRLTIENGDKKVMPGDEIELLDIPLIDGDSEIDINGVYTVLEDTETGVDDDRYILIEGPIQGIPTYDEYIVEDRKARIAKRIHEGDIVANVLRDDYLFYKVCSGQWEPLDRHQIVTPVTIFARQNLIDIDNTNGSIASSAEYIVRSIKYIGDDRALVTVAKAIPYFSKSNAKYIEGKSRVCITNVYPSVYSGWHTVMEVLGPSSFVIKIQNPMPDNTSWPDAVPVVNRRINLVIGEWYKYTISAYDWDKISNCATYVTSNKIMTVDGNTVKTKYDHKFAVGDYVILDKTGTAAYQVSAANSSMANLTQTMVSEVIDNTTFMVTSMDPGVVPTISTVYRGIIMGVDSDGESNTNDNLSSLRGEYKVHVNSLNDDYSFKHGDVVITLGQVCVDEIAAWRVVLDKAWVPLRKKRVIKIDELSVEQYHNPAFNEYDAAGTESEYKYRLFNDVEVFGNKANERIYFYSDAGLTRNFHFERLHVDNIDTTQDIDLQYSSKYDYGTVAPRNDMDEDFKGVPDMDYPLIEKIERLAYLKDASVIDFKLIEYLARYMGYDITAVADDINESNVYRTTAEREAALRETIAHLPQYYALGGTMPGVNMLMATFGIVGDLVTMWTNTAAPYKELLSKDEVDERVKADIEAGTSTGTWVPTPHVSLDIILNSNFNNILMGENDINALKEQIRRFKPINVVFDDVRLTVEANMDSKVYTNVAPGIAVSAYVPVVSANMSADDAVADEIAGIDYDMCDASNCVF